jgi:putative peptide maturation dehydrogenase
VPLFRRTKYVFVYCEDRQFLDIGRLLRGEAVAAPLRQLLAISVLSGTECVISQTELEVLLSVPSDEWSEHNGGGAKAEALKRLARHGLVLSDEPEDGLRELRRRDEALSAGQWNIYAALYHFMTKWHDVDIDMAAPPEPADLELGRSATAAFVQAHGPPPAHFHSVDRRLGVTPLPLLAREGGLWEALARRRTTRAFAPDPISLATLSVVLRYTFGCTGYSRVTEEVVVLGKTSPSGGGLHPTEVYPLIRHVEGVEPGIYHYGPERHELELLERLSPEDGGEIAFQLGAGQPFVRDAAVVFLITTRFYRNFWKYRKHRRAYAVLLMDAAHLTQTFYLVCAELGLGAFVTAAVNGRNIEERLGLDPFAEGALAMTGCGLPAPAGELDMPFLPYVPGETVI